MVKCSKNMISCLKNFPKEPHSFLGTCQRTMCPPPSRWCHLNAPNEWRRNPPRCAVAQNGPSSTCGPSQNCRGGGGGGGWGGEQACSTTRDHHGQHNPPRQTIVIPDTPSPAVSIITISSDTDEEDDLKQPSNTRSEKWDDRF